MHCNLTGVTMATSEEAAKRFEAGVHNIEAAIIEGVNARGGKLDQAAINWNQGRPLLPPPNVLKLRITIVKDRFPFEFSREAVDDSWDTPREDV